MWTVILNCIFNVVLLETCPVEYTGKTALRIKPVLVESLPRVCVNRVWSFRSGWVMILIITSIAGPSVTPLTRATPGHLPRTVWLVMNACPRTKNSARTCTFSPISPPMHPWSESWRKVLHPPIANQPKWWFNRGWSKINLRNAHAINHNMHSQGYNTL